MSKVQGGTPQWHKRQTHRPPSQTASSGSAKNVLPPTQFISSRPNQPMAGNSADKNPLSTGRGSLNLNQALSALGLDRNQLREILGGSNPAMGGKGSTEDPLQGVAGQETTLEGLLNDVGMSMETFADVLRQRGMSGSLIQSVLGTQGAGENPIFPHTNSNAPGEKEGDVNTGKDGWSLQNFGTNVFTLGSSVGISGFNPGKGKDGQSIRDFVSGQEAWDSPPGYEPPPSPPGGPVQPGDHPPGPNPPQPPDPPSPSPSPSPHISISKEAWTSPDGGGHSGEVRPGQVPGSPTPPQPPQPSQGLEKSLSMLDPNTAAAPLYQDGVGIPGSGPLPNLDADQTIQRKK